MVRESGAVDHSDDRGTPPRKHPAYTELQHIALLRRREAVLAGRKYADAVERGDTRAQHEWHRNWVQLKARAIEAELKL